MLTRVPHLHSVCGQQLQREYTEMPFLDKEAVSTLPSPGAVPEVWQAAIELGGPLIEKIDKSFSWRKNVVSSIGEEY